MPIGFGRNFALAAVQAAEEDEIDLVKLSVVPSVRYTFIDAGEAQGGDGITGFLKKLAAYGFGEHFTGALAAARQGKVLSETGMAAVDQKLSVVDDDGFCRVACRQRRSSLRLENIKIL